MGPEFVYITSGMQDAARKEEDLEAKALKAVDALEKTIVHAHTYPQFECTLVDVDRARKHLQYARDFINEGNYSAAADELGEAI